MASRSRYGAAQVKKGATGDIGGEGAAATVRAEGCGVRIWRPATEDAFDGGVHDALRGGGGVVGRGRDEPFRVTLSLFGSN